MYKFRHFGTLMKKEQIAILRAFEDGEDKLFFAYCDPAVVGVIEGEHKKLVEELAEETAEDYFADIVYIYDKKLIEKIDSQIKEVVYKYVEMNQDIQDDFFHDLMDRINKGDLDKIDKTLTTQIKYIISYELNVNNYDKVLHKHMKERMVFKNKIMFDKEGEYRLDTDVWWYCIEDDEELWKTMNGSSWGGGMIVTNRNRKFELYSYVLICDETAEDYDLLIYSNRYDEFEKMIMPKISQINESILKLIEKC